MIGWLVRHPVHAGVLTGVLVALFFWVISFPGDDRVQKTVEDWLPSHATSDEAEIDALAVALQDARETETGLETVSEETFRGLELDRSFGFPRPLDDGTFNIEYVGQRDEEATVYVATRQVPAAPWWHPDRLLYRAASYQVDRFGEGLTLSYERDWDGLGALLIMDAILGILYGGIIACVLSIIGARELDLPVKSREKRLPAEAPIALFRPSKLSQPKSEQPLTYWRAKYADKGSTDSPPRS